VQACCPVVPWQSRECKYVPVDVGLCQHLLHISNELATDCLLLPSAAVHIACVGVEATHARLAAGSSNRLQLVLFVLVRKLRETNTGRSGTSRHPPSSASLLRQGSLIAHAFAGQRQRLIAAASGGNRTCCITTKAPCWAPCSALFLHGVQPESFVHKHTEPVC